MIHTAPLRPFQLQGRSLGDRTLGMLPSAVGSSLPADLTPEPPALPAWAGSEADPGEGSRPHRAPGRNSRWSEEKDRLSATGRQGEPPWEDAACRRPGPCAGHRDHVQRFPEPPATGGSISSNPSGASASAASASAPSTRSSQGSGQHRGETRCLEVGVGALARIGDTWTRGGWGGPRCAPPSAVDQHHSSLVPTTPSTCEL